jgi:hypothetical protein
MRWVILSLVATPVVFVLGYVTVCEVLLRRQASHAYRPRYSDGGDE